MMDYSVIIPTHNNLTLLKKCVYSWLAFGYNNLEIIVIEDGCNDGTQKWLSDLNRDEVKWCHTENVFETLACNEGMKIAKGKYIIIWQDDMILKNFRMLERINELMEINNTLAVVGFYRGLIFRPLLYEPKCYEDLYDKKHVHNSCFGLPSSIRIVHSCVRPWMIKKVVLDKVGLFDDIYSPLNWDEADLHLKVCKAKMIVGVYPGEFLGYFDHKHNSTTSKLDQEWLRSIVLKNGLHFHERWDNFISSYNFKSESIKVISNNMEINDKLRFIVNIFIFFRNKVVIHIKRNLLNILKYIKHNV